MSGSYERVGGAEVVGWLLLGSSLTLVTIISFSSSSSPEDIGSSRERWSHCWCQSWVCSLTSLAFAGRTLPPEPGIKTCLMITLWCNCDGMSPVWGWLWPPSRGRPPSLWSSAGSCLCSNWGWSKFLICALFITNMCNSKHHPSHWNHHLCHS